MKKNFNLKKCLALLLSAVMVATNMGGYISAKVEAAEQRYVLNPAMLNTDGETKRATSEVTTLQGVDVVKYIPDGETSDKDVMRDRWNMSGLNISASDYKYVAVDYYYDSEEVTGGSWTGWKIGNDTVTGREMSDLVEEQIGPAIVDYDKNIVGDSNPPYMAKLYAAGWKDIIQQVYGYEVGATYTFSVDYYMPSDAKGIIKLRGGSATDSANPVISEKILAAGSHGTETLTYTMTEADTWFEVDMVQETGTGYYWNPRFTKEGSSDNLLSNADFAKENGSWIDWKIGGKLVEDKETSDGWKERGEIIPFDTTIGGDLNPKYMAQLTGNYTTPSGQTKTWVNTWQDIYNRIESGKTYVFSCDYYMPANAKGSIRFRGGDAEQTIYNETVLEGGTEGKRDTATVEIEVTQENKELIKWFGPCIVQHDGGGTGYYWNPSVTVKGEDTNLLQNADFTEGDVDYTGKTPEYMAINLNDNATSANWKTTKNSENKIVKNQWARAIFDVNDFQQTNNYVQMWLFPWGSSENSKGSTAVGTMYINNVSFYTLEPGQPSVTSISFAEESVTYAPGTSHEIPTVTVVGENYPIEAYDLELSGQKSENTTIGEDGKLYIGADETSETLTITAKSVIDESKTVCCTVAVKQSAQRVTVDLKNENGAYNKNDMSVTDNVTHNGVAAIKITPADSATGSVSRFNYWLLKNHALDVSTYQYVAVDYYYDVTGITNEATIADKMEISFVNYTNNQNKTKLVSGTYLETGKWARVIFDLTGDINTELESIYSDTSGQYYQMYFYPYGSSSSQVVSGTMYINNVSFYSAEVGQPAVTGVSFAENELTCVPGTSREIPTVTVVGNNYPIADYKLELNGQKSENTEIGEDGKLYIGADETSKALTITAKSVIDEDKTASCTIHVGQTAERVTVNLKNTTDNVSSYEPGGATVTDTTYDGVTTIKVTPGTGSDGRTTRTRFNYWDLKTHKLKVTDYQYVAVDYYYDVTGITDETTIADKMEISFANYTNNQNKTKLVSGTDLETGKWARVIFDLTGDVNAALNTMYSDTDGEYNYMYFYPYGNGENTAVGTMYIDNVSFYTSEIGQPAVTDVSFSATELKGVPGSSVAIPDVAVTGNNYPITAYNVEVSNHTSNDTCIRNGKLYIGTDEQSTTLTLTASSVVNPQQKDACTVTVVESTLPSGDPEYMAKMIGTYINGDGQTKTWQEVWQTFSEIETGETYEFSFNYFVPEGGTIEARITKPNSDSTKPRVTAASSVGTSGAIGTLRVTYQVADGDDWLEPVISKNEEGIAYVWNLCFNKAGVKDNLLANADFSEGDGSWIGWTIQSDKPTDKESSNNVTLARGHAIIPFDTTLLLHTTAEGATLSTSDDKMKVGFDFTTIAEELESRNEKIAKYGALLRKGTLTLEEMKADAKDIIEAGEVGENTAYAYTENKTSTLPDKYYVKISNSNTGENNADNRGKRTTAIAYVMTKSGKIYYSDSTINHSVMSVLKAIFNETYLKDEANVKDNALVAESLLAKALEQSKATYSELTSALEAAPTSAKQRTLLFDVHYALNNYAFVLADSATMQLKAKSGGADEASATLREAILSTTDVEIINTGTTYYISSLDGSDSNGGTSATSAVATYSAVQSKLKSGDKVLFERGGVYRGSMNLVSGVTYAAYGEGEKPAIYGSPRNYASCWETTETDNVWKCTETITKDIGTIVFDHGWAAGRRKFVGTSELTKNFDFYQNLTTGEVYLYLDRNPSEAFSDIEFCIKGDIMQGPESTSDVTIDNLSIKYGGSHGIAFLDYSSNITITNCEIAWIGGSLLKGDGTDLGENGSESERYGNGVEFWRNSSEIKVENNWIYQIYDAGITNQSKTVYYTIGDWNTGWEKSVTQFNITYNGNLIEYCTYGIEYFQGSDEESWSNIQYTDNIIRFAGFGWGQVRPDSWAVSAINGWGDDSNSRPDFKATNFVITGNTFDSSSRWTIMHYYPQEDANVTFKGNNYYVINTATDSEFAYWIINDENETPGRLHAWGQDRLVEIVKIIEGENPTGTIQYIIIR